MSPLDISLRELRSKNNALGLFLIGLILLNSCNLTESKYSEKEQKAIEIAEEEFVKNYGKGVLNKKPFKLEIKDSVYVIKGVVSEGKDGGVPYAIVDTNTLEILNVYHTK